MFKVFCDLCTKEFDDAKIPVAVKDHVGKDVAHLHRRPCYQTWISGQVSTFVGTVIFFVETEQPEDEERPKLTIV